MIYPDMILLDPVDPLTAFNIMRADVRLTARTRETVPADGGLAGLATAHLRERAVGLSWEFGWFCLPAFPQGSYCSARLAY